MQVGKPLISALMLLTFFSYTHTVRAGRDTCALRAMEMMGRKQFAEAIRQFDHCLGHQPADANLYFQRGTCYLLLKKPNIALVDMNQALYLDSGLYEAYYNRALAHQALKNYTFSESDFLIYKSRVGSDHKVLRNLALLMEEMQDLPAAIRYYSEYLLLHPDDKEVRRARAMALAETDSVQAAIEDLNICLQPDANDSSVWMCKGNVYYDAMMFAEAIDAYNVILLLHPGHKQALLNRADAYTSAGRYEEAVRDYQELSAADRYNPDYHFNTGFCYLQLRKNEEAILSFGKALDTDYPSIGLLLTLRGVAYNNLKMQPEACADWQNALKAGYTEAETYRKNHCP